MATKKKKTATTTTTKKKAAPKTAATAPTTPEALLAVLQARFEEHPERHKGVKWADVAARLADKKNEKRLYSLQLMENSGGEPDVVQYDKKADEYVFFDCCEEAPKGRRSLCYDRAGWESRKEARPKDTAVDVARAYGCDLLDEEQYLYLQSLGEFDLKTSVWLATPADFRELGGALTGDRRYGRTFIYCNGAQSYYEARGFRGSIRV